MNSIDIFSSTVVLVTLCGVAVIDLRSLTIPNAITLPLIVFGVVTHTLAGGSAGAGQALIGAAVAFGLLFPLYLAGGMGAGDVKLFAGIGAWLGLIPTLEALAIACVCASVSSLIVRSRRLRAATATALAEQNTLADTRGSAGQPLPFGPMAAIGTVVALAVS